MYLEQPPFVTEFQQKIMILIDCLVSDMSEI